MTDAFLDTNVLLYLLSEDAAKADRAEALVAQGGVISIQVLAEFTAVARRKLAAPWADLRDILQTLKMVLRVEPLTLQTHELAVDLAERRRLNVYEAQILAAAALAGCPVLYSEDMQDGLKVDGLRIVNPFRAG